MSEKRDLSLPWDYCYDGSSSWSLGDAKDPQASTPHISVWSRNDEHAVAACEFIRVACNNHDALVAACRAFVAGDESRFMPGYHAAVEALAAVDKPREPWS